MRKINVHSPGKTRSIPALKMIHNITALSVLIVAFGANAMAQCGGSFSAMMAAATSIRSQTQVSKSSDQSKSVEVNFAADDSVKTSIVGLWHTRFIVGDTTIQEAFQIWNAGGTEVHNPNVDPRQGNVCLGSWTVEAPQTFKLTHRVWFYDGAGNFQGTGHLSETLVLGDRGNSHSGTFTLQIFDPAGNQVAEVAGTVAGERISPN
jgi:hypothetical protein